jgi:hypothetical protein
MGAVTPHLRASPQTDVRLLPRRSGPAERLQGQMRPPHPANASGDPIAAIRPIFQITVRWLSRLVVTMWRSRPCVLGGDGRERILINIPADEFGRRALPKRPDPNTIPKMLD